jgi:phospholipid/cholesterol/gamma-HCH transport system ATP-binding protein
MADKGDEMPATLSGGMRKRVSIARALTTRPEILLFDEPTAGLDPPMAEQIDALIRRVTRDFHVTPVVVTHDMLSAFHLADRIHMLHEGTFVASGTAEQIRTSTDSRVRSFIARHLASA